MTTLQRPTSTRRLRLGSVSTQAFLAVLASAVGSVLWGGSFPDGLRWVAVAAMALCLIAAALVFGAASRTGSSISHGEQVMAICAAALSGGLLGWLLSFVLPVRIGLEIGFVAIASALFLLFNASSQTLSALRQGWQSSRHRGAQQTIIVGSGKAADSIVRLIAESDNSRYCVVGCVDDEVLASPVAGKPILGSIDDLPRLISQYKIDCVIIAIPAVSHQLAKRVMNACVEGVGRDGKPPAVKILPGLLELLNGVSNISRIRPVQPEDLLPREPITVDLTEVAPHVANRVILVTGAGGSIGSELCRQIARLQPSQLLLFGHGENSLFDIDEELKSKQGFDRTKIILGDVADAARVRRVFSQYRPHVVFHSAAHKHVPIVEDNVCEAARNNILGTHVVALAAAAAGTAKFVLLSTDKAVNPASVMGATKRVAELISQSFFNQTGTEFVTVRFGNVLESRGSVIPIFKSQIENGGPVTVTHKDMQRYFMTIPEAASLVMLAMAIGRDGQVLVLEMGQPVRIMRLAETLITLSGLIPYRDIDIIETGIRPGEKLFEEILTSYEGLSKTSHARLLTAQQERIAYDALTAGLARLEIGVKTGDHHVVLDVLRELVPSFQPGPHLLTSEISLAGSVSGNGHAELVDGDMLEQRASEGSQPEGVIAT